MSTSEVISRIRRGEDSVTQFKRQAIGVAKLADEMVAFANAEGGVKRENTSKDADSRESDRNQPKSGPKMVSSGPEVAQKWPKSSPETVQKLSTSTRQIYEALREEPRMTYRSLASKLGFVKETIRKGIGTLVKEGLVRRIGPKKGGRWEVIG